MFIGVASAWTPTRDNLIDRRHNVNDIRQGKCIDVIPTHRIAFNASASLLERKWATWGRFKIRSKVRESKCLKDQLMTWYYMSGAKCVHEHEGAWNDPNAPYWGGFQADLSFQSTYNPTAYAKYGTADRWPIIEQIKMAYRGWSARGWYPWPNTARACGLL